MNKIKAIKLGVLLAGVLMAGPAASTPPQQAPATERAPTYEFMNRFPRWLTPTVVDATYQGNFASRIRANGTSLNSISVDTRNNAHVVGLVDLDPMTPEQLPNGSWNFHYNPVIVYYNNRFDRRRTNGFSEREILYAGVAGDFSEPDVWVDLNDAVHVVWHVWNRQIATDLNWSGPRPACDIYYAVRGANGAWTISNITNCVAGDPAQEEMFLNPQIQVGSNGVVQIVALHTHRAYDRSLVWDSGLQQNRAVWTINADPQVTYNRVARIYNNVVVENIPYSDGGTDARFTLDANNNPTVVWVGDGNPSPSVNWTAIFCSRRQAGGWVSPDIFGGVDGNYSPDVAVDESGLPHVVWEERAEGGPPDPVQGIYYRSPDGAQVRMSYSTGTLTAPWPGAGPGRILADSRGQIHVFYSGDGTSGPPVSRGVFYAARVKNPSASTLNTSFSGEMPIAAPSQEVTTPLYTGALMEHIGEVAITKNDQIHVVGQGMLPAGMNMNLAQNADNYFSMYTRTMEYNLGVKDEAAMTGAYPGAAINVTNGNVHGVLPLFNTQGTSPCQAPQLIQNSLEFYSGLFAQGWKLNYEVYLIDHWLTISDPGTPPPARPANDLLYGPDCLTLFLPDGRGIFFRYNDQLGYHTADDGYGFYAQIVRQSYMTLTPEYLLTTKHGEQWLFDSSGRLIRITERTGNQIRLQYDVLGHLMHIVDQTTGIGGGRTTQVEYENTADGLRSRRVTKLIDSSGREYLFNYSGRYLSSVGKPESTLYQFGYGAMDNSSTGERINLLKTFTSPRGYDWTCRYLLDNRLRQIDDPQAPYLLDSEGDMTNPTSRVAILRVEYTEPPVINPPPPQNQPRETLVTNRRGNTTRYLVDSRRALVFEIHDPTMLNSVPSGFSRIIRGFDNVGNLTSETDRWNIETDYSYFASQQTYPFVRDNVMSVTRGGVLLATYTYTTDANNRVQTAATYARTTPIGSPVARTTSYTYDMMTGLVTNISHPTVTLANGQSQSSSQTFQYMGPRYALSRTTDEDGRATVFMNHHGTHGLPQTVVRPGGVQTEDFQYDGMGNVTQHRLPQGGAYNDPPGWTVYDLDALYRATSVTDPGGVETAYGYDADSNPTTVTPAAGTATINSFDARGFPTGGSGPDGEWSQNVDANGNVRRVVDIRGNATNTDYDQLDRVIQSRVPGGSNLGSGGGGGPSLHVTEYGLDLYQGSQHRRTITRSDGQSQSRTTTEFYDSLGRLASVLEADSLTRREFFYDEQNQILVDQLRYDGTFQACTIQFRDARNRVHTVRRQDAPYDGAPMWQENSYTVFTGTGATLETIGPRGNPTVSSDLTDRVVYTLDMRDRVTQVSEAFGGQLTIVQESDYGDDDLLVESRVPDPTGGSQAMVTARKYTYTPRKELKTVRNSNNLGLTYTYNSLPGQVDTVTDAMNRVTKTTYHSDSQRVNEVFKAWQTSDQRRTVHTWENGLLTQKVVWNPESQSENGMHRYYYDKAARLERLEAPGVAAERFSFNAFGEHYQHFFGQKTETRTYDDLGQETLLAMSGAYSTQVQSYYDGAGNLTRSDDGSLRKDTAWDAAAGRPTSESFYVGAALWKSQNHAYDAGGNYNRLTYPDPVPTAHEWVRDEAGRVTGIRVGGVEVSTLSYTRAGLLRLTVLRDASGNPIAQTTHDYDSLGRHVRAHTVRTGNQATLSDLRWEYDSLDRVVKIRYYHLGVETDIVYNGRDEVVSEETDGNGDGMEPPPFTNTFGNAPTGNTSAPSDVVEVTPQAVMSVPAMAATYTYDKGGNRISQRINGVTTTLAYDSSNRLVTETRSGHSVTHVYDEWGNESGRTTVEGSTTTVETYGYNYMNRMSSYVRQVGSTITDQWQYDFWPTGERYAKTNLATNNGELYVPSGDNVVADYSRDAQGTIALTNTYAQGLGLDQKCLRMPNSGGRLHYLGDMVGTLSTTLTDGGIKAEECVRDVWGNTLGGDTNDERYGFAQREHDMESGLVYMRHRMYDPRIGRFTQVDPILGNRATEHYRYGSNNPVQMRDPTGQYVELTDEDEKRLGQKGKEVLLDILSKLIGEDQGWSGFRFDGRKLTFKESNNLWGSQVAKDLRGTEPVSLDTFLKHLHYYATVDLAELNVGGAPDAVASFHLMRNWSIKAGAIAGLTATTAACSVYAGMVILEALPAATAFATTTATTSATAASSPRGQQVIQEIQSAFRPGKWLEHFMRHGEEFLDLGVRTSAQYLQRAQTLLGGAPGISTFVRAGGDKLFYRAATNEFLVVSKDNIIRTFFRPENGILYWFQETGQLLIQK